MSFLKNLRERAKILVLKLKTNEMAINVPKIVYQAKLLPSATVKGLTQKRRLRARLRGEFQPGLKFQPG